MPTTTGPVVSPGVAGAAVEGSTAVAAGAPADAAVDPGGRAGAGTADGSGTAVGRAGTTGAASGTLGGVSETLDGVPGTPGVSGRATAGVGLTMPVVGPGGTGAACAPARGGPPGAGPTTRRPGRFLAPSPPAGRLGPAEAGRGVDAAGSGA